MLNKCLSNVKHGLCRLGHIQVEFMLYLFCYGWFSSSVSKIRESRVKVESKKSRVKSRE
jgi:hypothetical protein